MICEYLNFKFKCYYIPRLDYAYLDVDFNRKDHHEFAKDTRKNFISLSIANFAKTIARLAVKKYQV